MYVGRGRSLRTQNIGIRSITRLPLIDAYRRYFGWRMSLIAGLLYVSIATAALIVGGAFVVSGLAPLASVCGHALAPAFALDYTFYLNLVAALGAAVLFWKARSALMHDHDHDQSRPTPSSAG